MSGTRGSGTWRDHVHPDERSGLISECDDGSAMFISSYSGGASPVGLWGRITLMHVAADGRTAFIHYRRETASGAFRRFSKRFWRQVDRFFSFGNIPS